MRLIRNLWCSALLLLIAAPASASTISVLVGDKDGFGLGLAPGDLLPCIVQTQPCISPIQDWRSAGEQVALTGAQFTDVYSALYNGAESDCPLGCSPNGATGTVIFTLAGSIASGSITMFMGDFQSSQFNAMQATINGIPISFFFDQGYRMTSVETITLTPAMIAAANLAGQVTLFLDHRTTCASGSSCGSFDYIAFDYFELNAVPTPEPGTWLLLGTGLAALAARLRRQHS